MPYEDEPTIPAGFDFDADDCKQIEIPFKLGGVQYWLCEISEGDAAKYRNARLASHVFNDKGNLIGFKNPADLEPMLLSMCCWRLGKAKPNTEVGREKVPREVIQTWPSRNCRTLAIEAQKISHLNEPIEPGIRDAFEKSLSVEGAPISLVEFRKWVATLDAKEFKTLNEWLEPSAEELAKNEQSGTENTTT